MNVDTPEGMEQAREWMERQLLPMLSNHAIWQVPRSKTTYQFNKIDKIVKRLDGNGDKPVELVMASLGWKVETENKKGGETTTPP